MANLKRNIRQVYKNIEPFWGKYSELNNAIVPDIDMIQQFQLEKIESFQKVMQQRVAGKNDIINQLFLSGNINSLISRSEEYEDLELERVITSIVGIMNGTYKDNKTKDRDEYKYNSLQQKLVSLVNILQKLNAVIASNNGQIIPEFYIEELKRTITACDMSSLNTSVLDEWFKHLNKFKGDLIEDIGVAWLNTMNIPNIQTLNTGALNYQGSGKFGRKGQLIQDLMTLEISDMDLDNISIEYKSVGGQMVNSTLRQFMQEMEKAKNINKQIILQDSGYQTLLELSTLNIQAKSGINQLPWNKSKSTSVSIGEYSDSDKLVISTRHTFELLHQLDQDNKPEKDIWVQDSSRDYNLMADYGLATVLFKVLHLEENGNDYILTPLGFTSFTDRIKYLMEKRRSRVTLQQQVTINDNTLGTSYNVSMTNYN